MKRDKYLRPRLVIKYGTGQTPPEQPINPIDFTLDESFCDSVYTRDLLFKAKCYSIGASGCELFIRANYTKYGTQVNSVRFIQKNDAGLYTFLEDLKAPEGVIVGMYVETGSDPIPNFNELTTKHLEQINNYNKSLTYSYKLFDNKGLLVDTGEGYKSREHILDILPPEWGNEYLDNYVVYPEDSHE